MSQKILGVCYEQPSANGVPPIVLAIPTYSFYLKYLTSGKVYKAVETNAACVLPHYTLHETLITSPIRHTGVK